MVGSWFELVGEDAMDTGHQFTIPDLQDVVLEFVQNFDSGLYPELEVA